MSTPQQIGGYIYRQQISRVRSACNIARQHVARIFDERPGPALAAVYIARIGVALGEIADAIGELERIGRQSCDERLNRSAE